MMSLLEQARTRGQYARRLRAVEALPAGLRATIELIDFGDVGDERRPVILSAEPLERQAIATSVPNKPPEVVVEQVEAERRLVTLDVRIVMSGAVRVRLGAASELALERESLGMLIPEALTLLADAASAPPAILRETADEVVAELNGLVIRLRRDPFGMSIAPAHAPSAAVETALDDRNVHGLLCTPPPGFIETAEGPAAFWSWALSPDERLYGLGERFTPLNHRGERLTLWTTDAWGTTTASSYKNVPFLHSSRGYGLFFHTPAPLTVQLGSSSLSAAQARVDENTLDVFIVFGATPKEILAQYTRLTGRATMPPRWALGVWLSRCRYQTRAEVEEVARRAREEDVPCDVLHIDPAWLAVPGLSCDFTSNEEAFPDLGGMVRSLGERGFKISLWELPYVSSRAPRYAEAAAAGYFLRDDDGEPICADFGAPPTDGAVRALLDFTNPAARAWWQDQHRPWLRAGVAVFKTDFGEGVPLGAHAYNGMTGHTLHNLFPLLYNAAVHEVITQETGRPGMVWGRSGWAGSQRYPAQWGGDPKTDAWSMASSLRGGLNLALSAPGIWAHDIGGFYGPPPSLALYIRWAQFGLVSPLARAHGVTPREPGVFGAAALASFRRYAKLRMRLNPYLYSLAWEAHAQGAPMLRPLMLEFPHDAAAAEINDQYMLGPSLLVAPIFSEVSEPVEREVYLPEGEWIDFWTDERITGGKRITRLAPLDTLPLYVRAGTILPLGAERSFLDESAPDDLTLEVYPTAAGVSQVVWDREGTATRLTLSPEDKAWALDIAGEHMANWQVRWHTDAEIVQRNLGRHATTRALLTPDERG